MNFIRGDDQMGFQEENQALLDWYEQIFRDDYELLKKEGIGVRKRLLHENLEKFQRQMLALEEKYPGETLKWPCNLDADPLEEFD